MNSIYRNKYYQQMIIKLKLFVKFSKITIKSTMYVLKNYGFIEVIYYWYYYLRITKSIQQKMLPIQEKYRYKNIKFKKYLNIRYWVMINLFRVYRLELHEISPKDILDIGCGMGYFAFICSYFGHKVTGLDLDTIELYNDSISALKIARLDCEIKKYSQIRCSKNFDYIVAFMICFNGHKTGNLWKEDEWEYFIDDLKNQLLIKNGIIFLSFNSEDVKETLSPELINLFSNYSAKINNLEIRL